MPCGRHPETVEVHILAGQSNAQGIQGDAASYPADVAGHDKGIPFWYNAPACGNSQGRWVHLGPQIGFFKSGYFGPEVAFARGLLDSGRHPAVIKFTQPSSSLARDWKAPGKGGLLDAMCGEMETALRLLRKRHYKVVIRSFTWIQGESDAETDEMARHYEERLRGLVRHVRAVLEVPDLPVILGMDEMHPWVRQRPAVVEAQKRIVAGDRWMAFLSMEGLEKFDTSHLTPAGLEAHGRRLFNVWRKLESSLASQQNAQP